MLHFFGIISAVLAFLAVVPYVRDVFKGTTKPNQASWLIWVALLVLALLSQRIGGAKDSLLLTIGDLIGSSVILGLAIFKGTNKWHWVDKASLVGAGIGFICLFVFKQPIVGLAITIFIDACGAVPTIRKSFIDPKSETLSTWIIVGVAGIFGAISVGSFNLVILIYPIYLIVSNFAVAGAMLIGSLRHRSVEQPKN
ncbi:MAG TPA: hypothetical protein VHQ20_01205 [Patescibacteria group bacterium]|nr:hypothetical protein [Patescibacteria group bacterium]